MQKPSIGLGAALGGLTSVLLIAVSYLANQLAGLPFIPFDLFDWLARHLPGGVVAFGIDTMVRFINSLGLGPTAATAKRLEQLQGLVVVVGGGLVFGIILAWVLERRPQMGVQVGAVGGGVAFALALPEPRQAGGGAQWPRVRRCCFYCAHWHPPWLPRLPISRSIHLQY